MSNIAKLRAEAQNSPAYRETERFCHLYGVVAMQASHESWVREEAMRFIRNATTVSQIKEGLERLAALNAVKAEVRLGTPGPIPRRSAPKALAHPRQLHWDGPSVTATASQFSCAGSK